MIYNLDDYWRVCSVCNIISLYQRPNERVPFHIQVQTYTCYKRACTQYYFFFYPPPPSQSNELNQMTYEQNEKNNIIAKLFMKTDHHIMLGVYEKNKSLGGPKLYYEGGIKLTIHVII